jgi:hypothetical protein
MQNLSKQQERLLNYLTNVGSITSFKGLEILGIFRTPNRISELKKMGYNINTQMVTVTNRWGEQTKVANYTLLGE